jgi:hypothetical protein
MWYIPVGPVDAPPLGRGPFSPADEGARKKCLGELLKEPMQTEFSSVAIRNLYAQYKDEYSTFFDPELPELDAWDKREVLRKAMARAAHIQSLGDDKQVLGVLLLVPKLNLVGHAVMVALYLNHKEDIRSVLVEMGYSRREISDFLQPGFYEVTVEDQVRLLR